MTIAPRKHVPKIMPYPPGKPIEEVRREYGLDSVVKLASNENPLGPSKKAIQAMQDAAAEMHLYPDGNGYYLKEALSEKFGIGMDQIMLASGSNEITDLLAMAYLDTNANVVCSQYDFIGFVLSAKKMGASVREAPLRDWRVDVEQVLDLVDQRTRMVYVANPGNPVGTMIRRVELALLLRNLPESTLVVLDEAYSEYVCDKQYPDGVKYLERHPNLIVTRTFSKAHGLAGLRIGYGFAQPDVVTNLNRVRMPFNVNRMAQAAALAALQDTKHIERSVETNEKGRAVLVKALREAKLAYVPSHTNFLLVDTARPASAVTESLLKQGVIVRPMTGYGLPNHVRVTIGKSAENRRFILALRKTLKEVSPEV